ncbi:hypothetical protein ACVBEQ_15365 [Nakamurella sp. GG22]
MSSKRHWVPTVLFVAAIVVLIALLVSPLPEYLASALFGIDNSQTFFKSLRDTVPAIVVALIISLTYERVRDIVLGKRIEDVVTALEAIASRNVVLLNDLDALNARIKQQQSELSPGEQVRQGLTSALGPRIQMSELIALTLPDRPVFENVYCIFRFSDSKPEFPNDWLIENKYQFEVTGIDEILIALCIGQENTHAVYNTIPSVLHVQHFDTVAGMRAAAAEFLVTPDGVQVATANQTGEFAAPEFLQLRTVDPARHPDYGLVAAVIEPALLTLMSARLRPTPQNTRRRVILRTVGVLDRRAGRCSYQEDRPAYIRQVTFDWSGVSDRANLLFNVSAFYTNRGRSPRVQETASRIEIDVNTWLVAGQGAVLTWRDRKDYSTSHSI